jgi:hypothetical protein
MAHLQDLGDVCHRQPSPVGRPDRVVALGPEVLGALREVLLLLRVVSSECCELAMGLWCFALRARDRRIVERISTN